MENIQTVLEYFNQYGYLFLIGIVFLEYLNLPGLPAGIILPAVGIMAKMNGMSFGWSLILSIISGLIGSLVLYWGGYYLGNPVIETCGIKFPRSVAAIESSKQYVNKYGNKGILISRMIPVARTLISLIAGVFRINIFSFLFYSTIGISIWNFTFIYAGYLCGDLFIK